LLGHAATSRSRGACHVLSRKSNDMSASHPSLSGAFYHMSDYVFFEYTGVVHLIRNSKESGAPIHCLAKMKAKDSRGNAVENEDLTTRAEDLIFMAISPGPERRLSNWKIWRVDEERVKQVDEARVGQLGDAAESKSYSEGTIYRFVN